MLSESELIDRICQISGFLAGHGDAAEIAAEQLRRLMDDIDAARAEPPVRGEGSSSRDHAHAVGVALDWRAIACRLWMLLDDIDTASDAAKTNDKGYREFVERHQRRRFDLLAAHEIDHWHAQSSATGSEAPAEHRDEQNPPVREEGEAVDLIEELERWARVDAMMPPARPPEHGLYWQAAQWIREQARQIAGYQHHLRECEQVAGRALGYPWFKDDQDNFPGSTEAQGVCIGEHIGETIVEELAAKYEALSRPSPPLDGPSREEIAAVIQRVAKQRQQDFGASVVDEWAPEAASDILSLMTGGRRG